MNGRILGLLEGVDPQMWMQVSYERLCADTAGEMDRIHRFIGVEREEMNAVEGTLMQLNPNSRRPERSAFFDQAAKGGPFRASGVRV
ncbi:MAG: hypothetical protein EOP84_25370 [Verrucomicrobiaceae bacterium]|nr:MAG: hypothetical protein EOP84_25370 [Verrucomicrobiaceae bacterium]